MTDQQLNTTIQNSKPALFSKYPLVERLLQVMRPYFEKFYSNKKIFLPVTIALGLVLIILILGILFGRPKKVVTVLKIPTPTPFVLKPAETSSVSGELSDFENKLNSLKDQINNLDIKQTRLKPPTLNFNVRF